MVHCVLRKRTVHFLGLARPSPESRIKNEQFNNVLTARPYQNAVLETDSARMANRVDHALRAIEPRFASTVRIDQAEVRLSSPLVTASLE
jgi:hypothetical protein